MTANEAIIFCLQGMNHEDGDGNISTRHVYDKNGDAHWISWPVDGSSNSTPKLYSQSPLAFSRISAPYEAEKFVPFDPYVPIKLDAFVSVCRVHETSLVWLRHTGGQETLLTRSAAGKLWDWLNKYLKHISH